MNYFRERYRAGIINTKAYESMIAVLQYLEEKNYSFVEMLGEGSFGAVLKVERSTTKEEYAVKVVAENHVSDGETTIWSTLQHQNLLPLMSCDYVYFAKSYIYFTPVHPTTLDKEIFNASFIEDKHALSRSTTMLKQILAAVNYLHQRNLSHLDIKSNNILISKERNAVLTDFGFLSTCETPVQRYGLPLFYRCPEGWMTEQGFREVDGKKFDMWSIGLLTFEMFTKMTLLTEVSKFDGTLYSWHDQIYPIIKKNLQKHRFAQLMHHAFPCSH